MKKILAALIVILALPLVANAQLPEERILSYHSDIEVFTDASIVVTETIKVVSAGDQILRGIYRDFPIAYKDRNGHRYLVEFELLGVKRDGQPEPYHTEKAGNGIRIYIGQEDVFIPFGEHVYELRYKTSRQLGFFDDHDELYWNVTGNGWVFPIDAASATVKLPPGISKEQISAKLYTGPQGSTAQDGIWRVTEQGSIEFAATTNLDSGEGLTIVVGWPKGVVHAPTAAENFWAALKANLDYIIATLGFLLVFAYYYFSWHRYGRDPEKNVVIPHYDAPNNLSPALMRYIKRMGGDDRGFAAAIINLGVKGSLAITEEKGSFFKGKFVLTKKADKTKAEPSVEEKLLAEKFFKEGESIILESKNASKISIIKDDFNDSLKAQTGKQYFSRNDAIWFIGLVFSFFLFMGTGVFSVLTSYGVYSVLEILFWPALALSLLAVNIVFVRLMRAYTVEGRRLVDEIEGFKLFLSVTEKDRLAFHNPPERTPELFEKFLPYALALDVEHQWSKQFADVFARLQTQGVNYAPAWYYGSIGGFTPEKMASSMDSSFVGAVSSASTAPGSSSGSSGGSGGGGGGGGGGGW